MFQIIWEKFLLLLKIKHGQKVTSQYEWVLKHTTKSKHGVTVSDHNMQKT